MLMKMEVKLKNVCDTNLLINDIRNISIILYFRMDM